ncbi:unnamed protein product [Ascophyllum nodosum]
MIANGIFIVGAKRTAFGSFGGSLSRLSATELAVLSSKGVLASTGLDPSLIDATFVGNAIQSRLTPTPSFLSCATSLLSPSALVLTINRLCGSGFETVVQGAEAIQIGKASVTLCAGTENMSAAPLVVNGNDARWGVPLGTGLKMEDSLWAGLTDSHVGLPMGMTAENLAEKYGVTREDCDEYASRSHTLWASGHASGAFDEEIVPVEVKTKKGLKLIDRDEHPRADTSKEKMAGLRPVFKKEGVVTAANASGICDGAGSLLVAGESTLAPNNITPLARLVAWDVVGCDPEIMGIGPAGAIRGALRKAGLSLADMDLIEINEAFAAQYLAVEKELGLDRTKTNSNGGAIAIGHPLGASGSRIMAHITHELRRQSLKYGVGAACIGGGQGIAIVVENVA